MDSECSTEVQSKGHESNGNLTGAWWLLSMVEGTVEKRIFTRQEYDWFCSQQEQKVKAVSKEVRDRI